VGEAIKVKTGLMINSVNWRHGLEFPKGG